MFGDKHSKTKPNLKQSAEKDKVTHFSPCKILHKGSYVK